MPNWTPHAAKADLKRRLDAAGLTYTRLSAKTISFQDLTRSSSLFVTIHGTRAWVKADLPKYGEIAAAVKGCGYIPQTDVSIFYFPEETA